MQQSEEGRRLIARLPVAANQIILSDLPGALIGYHLQAAFPTNAGADHIVHNDGRG